MQSLDVARNANVGQRTTRAKTVRPIFSFSLLAQRHMSFSRGRGGFRGGRGGGGGFGGGHRGEPQGPPDEVIGVNLKISHRAPSTNTLQRWAPLCILAKPIWCSARPTKRFQSSTRSCSCRTNSKSERWMRSLVLLTRWCVPSCCIVLDAFIFTT